MPWGQRVTRWAVRLIRRHNDDKHWLSGKSKQQSEADSSPVGGNSQFWAFQFRWVRLSKAGQVALAIKRRASL